MINWIDLILGDQLETIKNNSYKNLQIIFKHSTRCSISSMAKNRLDKVLQPEKADFFYLPREKFHKHGKYLLNRIFHLFQSRRFLNADGAQGWIPG